MAKIYVAGPVNRPTVASDQQWVQRCYTAAVKAATGSNLDVEIMLPNVEPALEHATPSDFYRQISGRISSSQGVITVYNPGDGSAPVESSLASVFQKKQLILTSDEKRVPRLLRGQPGVAAVVECNEWHDPEFAIRKFLSDVA
jgi:hypothetical protein